jgi:hypothetical protein
MIVLSKREATAWCRQSGISLNEHDLPGRSAAPNRFDIPSDAGKRVYLISKLLKPFENEPAVLVWFDEWGVWPSGERIHIFNRFRSSYGETRPLIEAPGHLFGHGEFEDAVSYAALGVLFLWDCYVLTPGADKFVFFSHDEFGGTNAVEGTDTENLARH